jgi:hypothetical protein
MEEIVEVFESLTGEQAPLIEADFDEPKPSGFPSYRTLVGDEYLTDEMQDEYREWLRDPENRRNALKPIASGPNMSFTAILDEIQDLHDQKSADYGRVVDPYANVRASEDFGIPSWIGAVVRANDKMRRLQKFAQTETLVNESVEDSLLDLATYTIIALDLYRRENDPEWVQTWE